MASLLALSLGMPAFSQYWEDAGQPSSAVAARICFTDTVHDQLLVAPVSPLHILNDQGDYRSFIPLYRYNGMLWDTIGLFGNVLNTAVIFNDTLIVGGAFPDIHDEPIKRIACYVDGVWQPYGDFNSGIEAAHIRTLRIVDGELYALGVFQYADGQFCNGLAKRVGGHWESLPNLPTNFVGDPWFYDIVKFQGKLVVVGNFHTDDGVHFDIMQYEGTTWQPTCDGCMHGGMDSGGFFAIYRDDLYMGCISHYGSGNPGQGIMRWDGEQWYGLSSVGAGLQNINYSDQYSPSVNMLKLHDGLLFMGGGFKFADHMPTPGMVTWDGFNYCTLGGASLITSTGVSAFDFYHDTLYVAVGVGATIGRGLVRYLSTDFQEECSTLAVPEADGVEAGFQVAWDPSGEITLLGLGDGHHQLRIMDPLGRFVLEQKVRSQGGRSEVVRFADRSMAVYLLNVDNQMTMRWVPTR